MRYGILLTLALGCGFVTPHDDESERGQADSGEGEGSGDESTGVEPSGESSETEEHEAPDRSPPRGLVGKPCDEEGQVIRCTQGNSAVGVQACGLPYAGDAGLRWTACLEELECVPGEVLDCYGAYLPCFVDDNWNAVFEECGFTPLAIDLGGDGFAFEPAGTRAFDIAGTGACLDVDWPIRSAAWLALDRDGDGAITDGRELFGSGTEMPDAAIATNGFAALATLDTDGDGAMTSRDAAFPRLVLWSDHDGDRRGTGGELIALAQLGIASMPLAYEMHRECDARGNCLVERTTVVTSAGPRLLVDLHLACQ